MYNRRFPGRPGFGPVGGNRFFGGGFLGPFILGGITGGLISRPNYYYPYPPAYFPPRPYPPRPYPGRPPRW